MTSFNVLSRSLNVLGVHLLEASAGTGKTFAIEHVIVRLLLEGLTIDQIVAMTFTRAAARELKHRVRANLENLLKAPDWDYFVELAQQNRTQEAFRKVEAALACFDEAQIFTIHGFCHRLLTEFAFEAKVGVHLADPDAKGYKSVMREVVEDFYRTGLAQSEFSTQQLSLVLKRHRNQIDRLTAALTYEMDKEPPAIPSFHELYTAFSTQLAAFYGESITELYEKIVPSFKKMTSPQLLVQVKHLDALLAARACAPEQFDYFLKDSDCFLEKFTDDNLKKKAVMPSLGILEEMRRTLLPLIQTAKDSKKILQRMGSACKKRWEAKDLYTPDRLLTAMQQALKEPSFVERVRKKYRAAIVDEFQDTDPVQWEIFQTLFLAEEAPLSAVYLVGDPKQSIYAFRKADVYTYLAAQQLLGDQALHYLDTNFRSDASLIQGLNTLFSAAHWIDLPTAKKTLPYLNVKPSMRTKERVFKDSKGSVHFFLGAEKNFLPYITSEIQSLKDQQIAILVKDRYQAEKCYQYLKKWGIAASLKRTGSLADGAAFAAVEQLIEALLHPEKFSQVLAGPFLAWNHHQLQEETQALALKAQFLKLCDHKSTLALHAFLYTAWNGRTLIEELAGREDLSLMLDFFQLTELLMEYEAANNASLEQLFTYLKELKNSDPEEEEALKIRAPDDVKSVQIMTVHMSKGLEFEVVFALGVAASQPSENEELEAEKLRHFFVALTRAKHRVYVPYDPEAESSSMQLFCNKLNQPLLTWLETACDPSISYTQIDGLSFSLHKQRTTIETALIPPSQPPVFKPGIHQVSFSSLAKKAPYAEREKNPAAMPAGAEVGILLHHILEKAIGRSQEELLGLIVQEIAQSVLDGWEETIYDMLTKTFALLDVPSTGYIQEMEFAFPQDGALYKGFIDLVFYKEGKYYIVDWKSNELPEYSPERLEEAMHDHDYFLQASIYATALERYVKLFDNRPFSEIFGGALYVFLRGPALYQFIPESPFSPQ